MTSGRRRRRKEAPNSTTEARKTKLCFHFRDSGSNTGRCRRRRLSRIELKFGGASVDARRFARTSAGRARPERYVFVHTRALHTTTVPQRRCGGRCDHAATIYGVTQTGSRAQVPLRTSLVSSRRDFPRLSLSFPPVRRLEMTLERRAAHKAQTQRVMQRGFLLRSRRRARLRALLRARKMPDEERNARPSVKFFCNARRRSRASEFIHQASITEPASSTVVGSSQKQSSTCFTRVHGEVRYNLEPKTRLIKRFRERRAFFAR